MAVCYRHPNRETNVGCSNCGRSICPDCMTATSVGMRCPECSRERTQVKRVNFGGLGAGAAQATYVLLALNVVAFAAEIATGASLFRGGGSVYLDGALFGPAVDDGEPWRLLTAGFLHYGVLHLGLNMFALYILGNLLEPGVGTWRFVSIYFVSLFGGSLGAMLLDPNAITVGASGAVFGLMAATFLIARERGRDDVAQSIGVYVLINLVFTFSIPNISIGGHLGGLVAGGLAAFLLSAADRRRGGERRLIEVVGLVSLGVLCVAAALLAAPDSTGFRLG